MGNSNQNAWKLISIIDWTNLQGERNSQN
jgi:hypothetical protein